jgi:asparagine synthase (glutamine-hydrolysing)
VADHCGTAHTEFEVDADAWTLLPKLVWEFGQPLGDPACIPTYLVAERARRHVTVALTGDGGDESFAGYSQHQGRYLGSLLQRVVPAGALDRLLRASTGTLEKGGDTRHASAVRFLRYAHADPIVNWGAADHWSAHYLARLWSPRYRGVDERSGLLGYAMAAEQEFDGASPLDRALHHDLNVLLPFCYNVKVDVATMMSSLEARCPFLDHEVVEWAARLPAMVKMRPWSKKALLKRVAARWLPSDVIYRRKHGFTLPVDAWFRGTWARGARDIIFSTQARDRGYFDFDYLHRLWGAHAGGSANHGMRFWSLLWLELWHRMFVDRTMSQFAEDETVTPIIATIRG